MPSFNSIDQRLRPNPAIADVVERCGAASPDLTFAAAAKLSMRRTGGLRTKCEFAAYAPMSGLDLETLIKLHSA